MIDKYEKIILVLCQYKGINKESILDILKDKQCKLLLFLLLKKYGCVNEEKLKEDFMIENRKSINYNCKKAQEKFFVNKKFRDLYFEMEEYIKKIM